MVGNSVLLSDAEVDFWEVSSLLALGLSLELLLVVIAYIFLLIIIDKS